MPLKEGDILKRPKYGALLKKIAEKGSAVVYEGKVAQEIVDAVRYYVQLTEDWNNHYAFLTIYP